MDELRRDMQKIPGHERETPLFKLGLIVMSPSAEGALEEAHGATSGINFPFAAYAGRHAAADWPELSDHEREANLSAIEGGHEITGAYILPTGKRILLVTAAEGPRRHRPRTTILLCEEALLPC
ncbi:MAG: hypothetical protein M3R38_31985 [Actinomycetota bacterium]|nr:hypothetical protein [Actinomycetota bacterium]